MQVKFTNLYSVISTRNKKILYDFKIGEFDLQFLYELFLDSPPRVNL